MQMTSTYDHRVIQGAQSGEYLRRVDQLLQGADGFYESIFSALGLTAGPAPHGGTSRRCRRSSPHRRRAPAAAQPRRNAARGCRRDGDRFRVSHARPSRGESRSARFAAGRRSEARSRDVRSDARAAGRDSGFGAQRQSAGQHACGHSAAVCARRTARRSRTKSSTFRTPNSAVGCVNTSKAGAHKVCAFAATPDSVLAAFDEGRNVRTLLAQDVPRPEDVLGRRPRRDGADARGNARDARPTTARSNAVLGMAHRGRLSVIAHVVNMPYEELSREFEAAHQRGEVRRRRRHGRREVPPRRDRHVSNGRTAKTITVTLAHNPSHLEAVDPVVEGRTRALQTDHAQTGRRSRRREERCADSHSRRRGVHGSRHRCGSLQPAVACRAMRPAARCTSSRTTKSASRPIRAIRARRATHRISRRASTCRSCT